MDFDTEKFINEVQKRPAIWNTKCSEYLDKDIKQSEWDELVDIYGGKLSMEEKKQLARNLHKKWRNIRDCFVKTHKARNKISGSAGKKKVQYAFYKNLLFLEDTVNYTNSTLSVHRHKPHETENSDTDSEPLSHSWRPQNHNKKNVIVDNIGRELIGVLNRNIEHKMEEDDDRLFFLSLVKEFKKIPECSQIQTKLDILKVIKEAQVVKFHNSP